MGSERYRCGILVCDMPERKLILPPRRPLPNMSQDDAGLSMRQEFYNENGPGDRGHSPKVLHQPWGVRVKPQRRKGLIFEVLQPEIGQVAIAR